MLAKCPLCTGGFLSRLGNVNQIDIYGCDDCKIILADSEEPTGHFYEDDYIGEGQFGYEYKNNRINKPMLGIDERRRCSILGDFKRIIEIGAGAGILQFHLINAGINCVGIERSKTMRDVAGKSLGVKLVKSIYDVNFDKIASKGFCVAMVEVIEHIKEPNKFIEQILDELPMRPNAFYFTTPNADVVSSWLGIQWEQVKPPEHLVLYSERGLVSLMLKFGYNVKNIVRYHSVFLYLSLKYLGSRSCPRVPIVWMLTGLLRKIDTFLCSILPSRYCFGLELLVIDNEDKNK